MRLFKMQPGDSTDSPVGFTIWHLDLDHVVSMYDVPNSDPRFVWYVQLSNKNFFFVTKDCFDRMMKAWES